MPKYVVAKFQKRASDLLRDFNETILAVHDKRRQASLESMLAEQTAMSLAVYWEAFLNDIIIQYIVLRPKSCFDDISKRYRQSLGDKFAGIERWVSISFPNAISNTVAERIIDPKGLNVVATSAQILSDVANRFLSAVDARKFSLTAEDREFIDYFIALRNYLGHRSAASRTRFLAAARSMRAIGPNAQLTFNGGQIGVYLKQRVDGVTRVGLIVQRIVEIAGKLA